MKTLNLLARLGLGIISTLITISVFALVIIFFVSLTLPNVSTLKDAHMQVPMKIYSADHQLMGEFGIKKRTPVPFAQIPPLLVHAVLATEDARFYHHSGIDIISIARAAKAVIQSGKKVQGASTITMQVARNFFLNDKKTYGRKIREMILAMKIDHEFSKNKILNIYLNKIYLGARAYGVAAAAQVYYGKQLNDLTLPQIAMLAGLPQAPSAHNPLTHPQLAKIRRNHVLARMLKLHYITQQQYQTAINTPVTASYHEEKIALDAPYATEMIRKQLYAKYGDRIYEDGFIVYSTINSTLQNAAQTALDNGAIQYSMRHGFIKPQVSLGIFTPNLTQQWTTYLQSLKTLPTIQPAAVTSISINSVQVLRSNGQMVEIPWRGLSWAKPYRPNKTLPGAAPQTAFDIVNPGDIVYVMQAADGSWKLSQYPQVEGAILSLNPHNGAIVALTGGTNYSLSHFDRATQAVRQAGSSFKPFIYSAALAKGKTLATMLNDAPIVIADNGENTFWRPHNDTHQFYGMTSLREALIESRNIVSVRLLQAIGVPYALNYLTNFGFNTSALPHSLSLALGSGGVTPLALANGYTVFANTGYRVQPHLIASVTDEQDKTIIANNYPVVPNPSIVNHHCSGMADNNCIPTTVPSSQAIATRTITPQIAFLMTSAMQDVIKKGTGRRAMVLNRDDLAGKTGTTNNQVDAWFSGFNGHIETTVWLGFDDNQRSLHEYADTSALPIWIDYMKTALANTAEAKQALPENIESVRIDPTTGLLAPMGATDTAFEYFRNGYAPTEVSKTAAVSGQPVASASASPASSDKQQAMTAPLF